MTMLRELAAHVACICIIVVAYLSFMALLLLALHQWGEVAFIPAPLVWAQGYVSLKSWLRAHFQ